MKTLAQIVKERPDQARLIKAVVSRIGKESIMDVINHGIDGGFGGFCCYCDTVRFFRTHRKVILEMAEELADDLGEDMLTTIQNFGCLGKEFSLTEIGQALFTNKGEMVDQVQNAMAWFAAEEVCRMFED